MDIINDLLFFEIKIRWLIVKGINYAEDIKRKWYLLGYFAESTTYVVKNTLESFIDMYMSPYIERNVRKERLERRESTSSCGEIFFENQLVWKISFRSPSGAKERSTLHIPIGRN